MEGGTADVCSYESAGVLEGGGSLFYVQVGWMGMSMV
jgi:hypothetical protein